jgi:hypothetical protein
MGMEQTQKYCSDCKADVLAQRKGVNHILHLLLTIVTGGLWIIIWLVVMLASFGGWRCSKCGKLL